MCNYFTGYFQTFHCFEQSRFGLPWFAKRIIVASNDINEDTLFSLNQQVTLPYVFNLQFLLSCLVDLLKKRLGEEASNANVLRGSSRVPAPG